MKLPLCLFQLVTRFGQAFQLQFKREVDSVSLSLSHPKSFIEMLETRQQSLMYDFGPQRLKMHTQKFGEKKAKKKKQSTFLASLFFFFQENRNSPHRIQIFNTAQEEKCLYPHAGPRNSNNSGKL